MKSLVAFLRGLVLSLDGQKSFFRTIGSAAKTELRWEYRRSFQPGRLSLAGVELDMTGGWATPQIAEAIYGEWYESAERSILEGTLGPEDVYVELGGGAGYLAVCACRRVGSDNVRVYEANPGMAAVARGTALLNGCTPGIIAAMLGPSAGSTDFYVAADFWRSGLTPSVDSHRITVPVDAFEERLTTIGATYLMVDIEGGEVDLLMLPIPACVRKLCVETHVEITGGEGLSQLLQKLAHEGFELSPSISRHGVLYLARA